MVMYWIWPNDCVTMPRRNKQRNPRRSNNGGRRMVNVSGPGGFRLNFPIPRLPRLLGAGNNLAAQNTVYPRIDLDMPTTIQVVAVSTGALASVIALDPNSLIPQWAARSQLFREYAVVGARFEFSVTSSSNASGCVVAFVDETLATAPNAGSVYTPHLEIPIPAYPDAGVMHRLDYKPAGSYTDLDWIPVSSTTPKQWLKLFASTAATGTSASTTGAILVRGTLAIAFRGYANF